MTKVFSRRQNPDPQPFREDIPEEVRSRILHLFRNELEHGFNTSFEDLLIELEGKLLRTYGRLCAPGYEIARTSNNNVIEHFFSCDHTEALDFIELCFQTQAYNSCGDRNRPVAEINDIFRERGIRYELTPFLERRVAVSQDVDSKDHPVISQITKLTQRKTPYRIETVFPQVIPRTDAFLHDEAIRPCLEILRDVRFRVANDEFLKAFSHYRSGSLDDAITGCGSAFESVLKTICEAKGWGYDRDKDTCSKLVDICKDKGLFPRFYDAVLKSTGTIRNKLGDAHGRGPTPIYQLDHVNIEHLFHLTAANILLVLRFAKLD